MADSIEQGEAVIPDGPIFNHHHDAVEKVVYRLLHMGHLQECGGIVPLAEMKTDSFPGLKKRLVEVLLRRFREEGRIDPFP